MIVDLPSWEHFGTHEQSAYPELWNGCAGYWPMCLGPTGSRIQDVSGQANWGTLTNVLPADAWVTNDGRYSISLSFSGVARYVEIANRNRSLDLGDSGFSVMAWARPTLAGTSVGRNIIELHQSTSPPYISYGLQYEATDKFSFYCGFNSLTFCVSTISSALNNWYHVVGVYTGTVMQVWVNGQLGRQQAETRANSYNGERLTLGTWPGDFSSGETWFGQISDAAIFRRVLSPNEIRLLYEIGRGGMLTPAPTPALFAFPSNPLAIFAASHAAVVGG